ncbi:hypothetical protein [Rhodopseudomonas sp.]|uniref:hypothetical protein n=1 Tax=Rhodopseudomonas sp. TaxID=1078 RepID=UPI0039E2E0BB
MPKFEKPTAGNRHRLTVNQHTFPTRSISRFAGSDGRVALFVKVNGGARRAKPKDAIFCAKRVWDHSTETVFAKTIEDRFQVLAELIVSGSAPELGSEQLHAINLFQALWIARSELRESPKASVTMVGILPGRSWSKDEEEGLEKNGYAFSRGAMIPAHVFNGIGVRALTMRAARRLRSAQWGIVESTDGEFIVPDWPSTNCLPIAPKVMLASPASHQQIGREVVAQVNGQIRQLSRRYYFARDFNACP